MEQQYTEFVATELQKTPADLRPLVENIYLRHLEYSQSNEAERSKILARMIKDYPLKNPENLLLVTRVELLRIAENTSEINQFFRTDGFLTRDYLRQYMGKVYSAKEVKLLTKDPMKFFSTHSAPNEFVSATDLYMTLLKSSDELSTKSGLSDFKDSNLFAARTLLFNFVGAGLTFAAKSNTTVPSLINCLRAGFSESTTPDTQNKVNSEAVMGKLQTNPNTQSIILQNLEPFNTFVQNLCDELGKSEIKVGAAAVQATEKRSNIPLAATAMLQEAQTRLKEVGKFSSDIVKYKGLITLIADDISSDNPLELDSSKLESIAYFLTCVIKKYEELKATDKLDNNTETLVKAKIESLVNTCEETGNKIISILTAQESIDSTRKDPRIVEQFTLAIACAKTILSPPESSISPQSK